MRKSPRVVSKLALLGALTLGLASPIALSPAPVSAAKKNKGLDLEMDVKSFTLENGLRVYVVEDHSTPAFNITLYYDVGSVDEVEGRTGFAHFFEHMMFQGSKNMGPMAIAEYTTRAGGNMNASTSFDVTRYYHNLPSNYLDMILWGESDRLRSLEITDETFEVQRAAVKSEKDRAENQPFFSALQEHFLPTVFAGTPYSHPPIGSLEDLNAAKTADVQAFFDKYYRPNNCTMVLVGDLDFAEVQEKVGKYFGDIPKGEAKPPTPASEQKHGEKIEKRIEDDKAKQGAYLVGWPTVGDDHPDRPALDLLGEILFGGDSARVNKILTDDKKLTVATFGGHQGLRNAGMVQFIAVPKDSTKPEDVKSVLSEELTKIAKKGVSKKELEKAINSRLLSTVSTLATNQGRADAIAVGALWYDDPKRIITDLEKYREVTNKDIKRVAAEYVNENWIFFELVAKG
jgi:zinc protease